jgi:hypothetical protein
MRRRLRFVWAVVALVGTPTSIAAQVHGAYLPLDHPAHPVAELLVARGTLRGLEAAQRPFPLRDLRRALAEARSSEDLGERDAAMLDFLDRSIGGGPPADRWSLSIAPEAGLHVGSSSVPELLLAEGDSSLTPLLRLRVGAEFGPASVQFEPQRLQDGRARIPVALARLDWEWGSVQWGELEQNWGPPGATGLLLSPLGGTRSELGFTLGPRVLRFEYRTAPLSDGVSSDTGETVGRIWSMHRLRWRPSASLELAIWETVLTPEPGGPDVARFSPFTPFAFPGQQGRDDGRNITSGVDASWRVTPGLQLEAQFLIDDIVLRNRDSQDNPYPHRFGYTLQGRGPAGAGGAAWRVYTAALSGLALNTFRAEEAFLDDSVGLGRLRPDHFEAGGFVTLPWGFGPSGGPDATRSWPGNGVAEVGIKWRRQGIRTFNDSFPSLPQEPGTPRYPTFSPEIEREVWALAGTVSWMPGPFTLRTETHLQYRRFPDSGAGSEWALEALLEVVWRIGRWSWAGTE